MAVLVRRRSMPQQQVAGWSPFSELQDLQERMGQLMESAMTTPEGAPAWVPDVDIEETDDAWIVEAEIPGAEKGDVNVDMRDSEVIISGEIKRRERKGVLRRRTRRVGEFEFRMTLPGHVNSEKIDADLRDGVLTVRIPKAEEARSRHIEIRDSHQGRNGDPS
jgi:HSP20 family protein